MEDKKTFLIINSFYFGDILLVNPLIQNIKRIYSNSKIIMVTSKAFYDVAKYQTGADEIVVWDRKGEHKGFFGMIKFLKSLSEKNIYAAFPIYGTDRPIILSVLSGAKYILFQHKKNILKIFKKSKYKFKTTSTTTQAQHIDLLQGITKEKLKDCAMKYNPPKVEIPYFSEKENEYTVLCPTTSKTIKDMPAETISDILNSAKDKKFVLLGSGASASELSEKLKQENHKNLIDLTNKTTIVEASNIIQKSIGVISADTGLMHLTCALQKEVICVFYGGCITPFMPDSSLYKSKVIMDNQNADNILREFEILTSQKRGANV